MSWSRSIPPASSSMGWMSGGSLMMRRWPSTMWVSLSRACMLSRVRALATVASPRLAERRSSWVFICSSNGCASRRQYQTSRLVIAATRASRIGSR